MLGAGRVAIVMVSSLICTGASSSLPAQATSPPTPPAGATAAERQFVGEIPAIERGTVLPRGWDRSSDRVVTVVGDQQGLHVLVAEERRGYRWGSVATLSEPGLETDRWVGNACVSTSGRHVFVVYAPRTFSNEGVLFARGGFGAVVELRTGAVTKLAVRSTLAYYNPGCGTGEDAVFTQESTDEDTGKVASRTRLFRVNGVSPGLDAPITLAGQITSAVPTKGWITAASARSVVRVAADGRTGWLATTSSTPYRLVAESTGAVSYLEHNGGRARAVRLATTATPVRGVELGRAEMAGISLQRRVGGGAWLVGPGVRIGARVSSVTPVAAPAGSTVSSQGHLTVLGNTSPSNPAGEAAAAPGIELSSLLLGSGERVRFTVHASSSLGLRPDGGIPSPAGAVGAPLPGGSTGRAPLAAAAVGSATSAVDVDATCSVPRNDARLQVYQPTPRQVEWAADQAVVGQLTVPREANWKQSGLPAWTPQGLFPAKALVGGGRVPAQVLLGVLAQESNLWQASRHTAPGVTGNPLVSNFYGRPLYDGNPANDWDITWADADCGYGISQRTDGMRKAGFARPGEVLLSGTKQKAVALDYATNIAAGLQVLQDKWNQTRSAGLIHSNGDPRFVENWIFAIWAYNSGFHPNVGSGSPWGVGWVNNPANPHYPPDRGFFNAVPTDAAHPQDWPYPEKVIGWAALSITTPSGPGFRAAWWVSADERRLAKPPVNTFCTSANTCAPGQKFTPNAPEVAGEPAGPCAHLDAAGQYDLKCWWHDAVTYHNCRLQHPPAGPAFFACGNELLRFDPGYAPQPDGENYPPECSLTGLPPGALVIDDVPITVTTPRPDCHRTWTNSGTFGLTFPDKGGLFPAKVDFHQLGAGFGGHFWFAHTRSQGFPGGNLWLRATGKWTLDRPVNAWARVQVHMPDHGAHTQQARYVIGRGDGTTITRHAVQQARANRWVSLGAVEFSGVPSVTLSTDTFDGNGSDDIAWDAVAFEVLPAKPKHFVVALGDSYSSGEGANDPTDGHDYYGDSAVDARGPNELGRNACHRSKLSWSRKSVLADELGRTIGERADAWDPTLDYQFHACSGAVSANVIPYHSVPVAERPQTMTGSGTGQYGELSQIDKGYLDENTTLVTMSIGGNDARFTDIIKNCIHGSLITDCPDAVLTGDTDILRNTEPAVIAGPVKRSVVTALLEIHKRAPNAKILLMGYPHIFTLRLADCVVGINFVEAEWVNAMVDLAADTLSAVAAEATAAGAPTWFSDPREQFEGHSLCGDPEGINNIVLSRVPGDPPVGPSNQSLHPNPTGTTYYATAASRTLRAMGL